MGSTQSNSFLKKSEYAIGRLSWILAVIGTVPVLLMSLHITISVIVRELFNLPVFGTNEIVAYYYMVAIVCLPLSYLELNDEHVTADVVYVRLSKKLRKLTFVIAGLTTCVFFSLFTYQSWLDAVQSTRVGEMVIGHNQILIWPSRFLLPISFSIFVVAALLRILKVIITPADPTNFDFTK